MQAASQERSAISYPGLYGSRRRRMLTLPTYIGNAESLAWMPNGYVQVLVVRR
jgi:hypothetical protein